MSSMDIIKGFLSDRRAPLVISPANTSVAPSLIDLLDWIGAEHDFINRELHEKGAILFRGFNSILGANEFDAVVSKISPTSATDDGSTSPRTRVSKRSYTSTDTPSYIPIELHQERSFNKEFPRKIAFFCDVEPGIGGETPIVDMRLVYRDLPGEVIDRFEKKRVQLRRRLPSFNYLGNRAIRTWKETFETNAINELEEIANDLGWKIHMKDCPFGVNHCVDVDNPVCPASISHPVTNERVWFNQAHVLNNSNFYYWAKQYGGFWLWLTALISPILKTFFYYHHVHGDGTEILSSDLDAVRTAIATHKISFHWQKGDLLILDNILMAHGRNRYSGQRRILVSLMN